MALGMISRINNDAFPHMLSSGRVACLPTAYNASKKTIIKNTLIRPGFDFKNCFVLLIFSPYQIEFTV
jgi:hypothetical protein